MTNYTHENFCQSTHGVWTPCEDVTDRAPDYTSASGSQYWYTRGRVYRKADHWGAGVASCNWFVKGQARRFCSAGEALTCTIRLSAFVDMEEYKAKFHNSKANRRAASARRLKIASGLTRESQNALIAQMEGITDPRDRFVAISSLAAALKSGDGEKSQRVAQYNHYVFVELAPNS